jgi:hypothetical protein
VASQRYVIHGAGSIVSGDIRDSQIVSQSGTGGTARITVAPADGGLAGGGPDRWLEVLGGELARIRRLLEPLASTDRDDAMDAVTSLEADLPEMAGGTPGTLRRRLKGLLGALDPVVKIIGGVATLEEILRHL